MAVCGAAIDDRMSRQSVDSLCRRELSGFDSHYRLFHLPLSSAQLIRASSALRLWSRVIG